MDLDILTIENGKVTPTLACYTIPELKAVTDNYKDPIPPLCYLYYKAYPKGPYANLSDLEQDDVILNDYPGDYSPEDEILIAALEKLNYLYLTPTRKFFQNAKKGLETMGDYLATTEVTDGRDGNAATFSTMLNRVGTIITQFNQLEKAYDAELGSGLRGNSIQSYDENDE